MSFQTTDLSFEVQSVTKPEKDEDDDDSEAFVTYVLRRVFGAF